jgi:hypothetical protein
VPVGAHGVNAGIIGNASEVAATGRLLSPGFLYSDFFSGYLFYVFRDDNGSLLCYLLKLCGINTELGIILPVEPLSRRIKCIRSALVTINSGTSEECVLHKPVPAGRSDQLCGGPLLLAICNLCFPRPARFIHHNVRSRLVTRNIPPKRFHLPPAAFATTLGC